MAKLEKNHRKLLATGYIVLLIGAVAFSFTALPSDSHAASTTLGVVIPLYTYPTDSTWTAVIQAKQAHPNVPFIAVINPASGPGTSADPNYVQGIKNLQSAGVQVFGYVDTAYGGDSVSSVESNVNLYHVWYAVNGIMFDDMTNQVGFETYYSTLSSYVHSDIPGGVSMGNPGTSVPSSFIGTLDILNVYEGSGYPSISFLTYPGYSAGYFSNIIYGVSLSASFLTSELGVNAWTFITDNTGPSGPCYCKLPSYFTTEVADLSSLDGSVVSTSSSSTKTTSTTSTTSGGSASLTVNSVDLSGNAITGMWTTLQQNGATLATGYTPVTFSVNSGSTYAVTVANFGSTVFCHWTGGNTNPTLTLSLSGNAVVTADYSTNGSCPASSTTSTTVSTTTTKSTTTSTVTSKITVTVESSLSTGIFTGMYTSVLSGTTSVATGYTTLTFTATSGTSYTVTIDNYASYTFSHWSTGSTSPTITITPSQAVTLIAYFTLSTVSCTPKHKGC